MLGAIGKAIHADNRRFTSLNAQLEFTSAALVQLDSELKSQTALGALEAALQLPADSIAAVIGKISAENPQGKKP